MSVRLHSFRGEPAIGLKGGDYAATFLPDLGMLGVSLRWRGRELLSLSGGLDGWRSGRTTGLPLLAPWANRLSRRAFSVGSQRIDLDRIRSWSSDSNGLPIHGLLLGAHVWDVTSLEDASDSGRLVAEFRLDVGSRLARAYPFPHRLEIDATVDEGGLRVRTSVTPLARRRVPVTFGWHPYLRLPTSRSAARVAMPRRRHLELDERQLPSGRETAEPAAVLPLDGNSFDDAYRWGRDRRFTIEAAAHRTVVEFDGGYPFGQLYAPPGKNFVAIEPMTARTNALVEGDHPWLAPGDQYHASFRISAA